MRRLALALVLMTTTAATAGGLGEMTEEERAAFREEVRAYLLENPEVIVEAMTVLQAQEDEAAFQRDIQMLADNADAIFNNPNDWVGGNPDGDITIVEFMDYRCKYCRQAFEETEELVKSDGNIRFVLKEFPVLGPASVMAAKFAIAVRQLHGDEAYKIAHDELMAVRAEISEESLAKLSADLGHDWTAILSKMNDPAVQAMIDETYALADKMEINGTPTFVIDQTMVRGYVPLDGMRQIVEGERQDG